MDAIQELEHLRARVAHLESLVERLTAGRTDVQREPAPARDAGVNRRRMLRHGLGLSAAAVAGVGALDALGSSAAATDGDPVLVGQTVSPTGPDGPPTRITNPSSTVHSSALFEVDNTTNATAELPAGAKFAIAATIAGGNVNASTDSTAIVGVAPSGTGLHGIGAETGVRGEGGQCGIVGFSGPGTGIRAESTQGVALRAVSGGSGIEASSAGTAIKGDSSQDCGVQGSTDKANMAGVLGSSEVGEGVVGISESNNGISGYSTHGSGVRAESVNSAGLLAVGHTDAGLRATSETAAAVQAASASGPGLQATSTNGLGATFSGGRAAIRLVPHATPGPPTSGDHQRGEIVVDHKGRVWACTAAGAPGTWKQLAFV